MSVSCDTTDELRELLAALREDAISGPQADRLADMLHRSSHARRTYIHYMALVANIRSSVPDMRTGLPAPLGENWPIAAVTSGREDPQYRETPPALQDSPVGSSCPSPAPMLTNLPATLHGPLGYISEGWPLAYLIASVITGLGILGLWLMPVSQPEQLARQFDSLPSGHRPEGLVGGRGAGGEGSRPRSPLPSVVGRITGMVDCQLGEGSAVRGQGSGAAGLKSLVALGDKFDLASGLMEITYDTGAKVILQGPVTFEVESNGGYLAVGKLTGKLEKNEHLRTKNEEVLSSSSSLLVPNSYFVIRTPTATVTDLGTEFGVETDGAITESQVFQGEVEIVPRADHGCPARPIRLKKNQSAVVDRSGIVSSLPTTGSAERFIRTMPHPACGYFPNLRDGTTVFEETFRIASDSPAVDYASLKFARFGLTTHEPSAAHAVVRDGVLRLCEEAPGEYVTMAMTTRKFFGRLLVCVDIGRDSVGIVDSNVGLRLGDLAFVFHPGGVYEGRKGVFRLQAGRDRQIVASPDMGFIPYVDVLHHLSVYYDGKSDYQVCLIDGLNPRHVFRHSFSRPEYNGGVAFSVGVHREGNVAGIGMFSNLRVIQFPASDNATGAWPASGKGGPLTK